jgi:hypothetical protein
MQPYGYDRYVIPCAGLSCSPGTHNSVRMFQSLHCPTTATQLLHRICLLSMNAGWSRDCAHNSNAIQNKEFIAITAASLLPAYACMLLSVQAGHVSRHAQQQRCVHNLISDLHSVIIVQVGHVPRHAQQQRHKEQGVHCREPAAGL